MTNTPPLLTHRHGTKSHCTSWRTTCTNLSRAKGTHTTSTPPLQVTYTDNKQTDVLVLKILRLKKLLTKTNNKSRFIQSRTLLNIFFFLGFYKEVFNLLFFIIYNLICNPLLCFDKCFIKKHECTEDEKGEMQKEKMTKKLTSYPFTSRFLFFRFHFLSPLFLHSFGSIKNFPKIS